MDRYRREVARIMRGEPDPADVMREAIIEIARLVEGARTRDEPPEEVLEIVALLLSSEPVTRAVADV